MRVLLVTGIWPPDVGGPATHGPELARFLIARGHDVTALTMADAAPADHPCRVVTVDRGRPFVVRYPCLALRTAALARGVDVVYASATYAAAAAGAAVARRPLVVKLVSDPAYERARRYGLFTGTLEKFQSAGGVGVRALKAARTRALARARRVVVPSAYLADIARGWGVHPVVVPNPAPDVVPASAEAEAATFVFVGRLTRQKALGTAIDAIGRVQGARLVIVGDGPDRAELERRAASLNGRVELRGSLPRAEALETLSRATAAVLSSDWENLPHAAVEALALGVPVVATAVGGVPEVVQDDVNGLLVPPGRPDELAAALARLVEEPALRARLAAAAAPSVAGLSRDTVYGRLEEILLEATR